jgi:hypothetical protein
MTPSRVGFAVLACSVAAAAVLAFQLPAVHGAADEPAQKPIAEIEDVMFTVNDDGADGAVLQQLRAAFKKGTLTDDEWQVAKARASVVAEVGNLLLTKKPPKGGDTPEGLADWKKRVLAYRDGAEAVRAAAAKKDATAGKDAVRAIEKQCTECHKQHRVEEE